MTFVHLHTHSHYSIGHALPRVRELVERAALCEMPALALTDHDSIAGMLELNEAAEEFGIQPIIGCELSILPYDHGVYQGRLHRLVTLVENEEGYWNLVALLSRAHTKSPDVPPHITFPEFERSCRGLIVLTGARRSELYYWLRERNVNETRNYLNRLAAATGVENLFFEILEYPHPRTRDLMDQILELSRFLRIPAVATQNVYFLDPEDMPAYCALVQYPRQIEPRWPLPDTEMPTRHFTTPYEMRKRFCFTPELLDTSLEIARRCQFRFPRSRSRVPLPDFQRGQDSPSLLWDLVIQGAAMRFGSMDETLKNRLNEEYTDLCDTDYGRRVDMTGYILMLRDITNFLRREDLCHGAGCGPILTSVLAYTLGIIEVNPLSFGFPYVPLRPAPDRFPVFELEVSTSAMARTLAFLRESYGRDNIASVGRRLDWERQALFETLSKWVGLPLTSLRKTPTPDSHKRTRDVLLREIENENTPLPTLGGSAFDYANDDESLLGPRPQATTSYAQWDEDDETSTTERPGHTAWVNDPRIPRDESFHSHEFLARVVHSLHPCPRGFEAERAHYTLSREPIDATVPVLADSPEQRICQAESETLDRLLMPRIRFTSFAMLNVLETARAWVRQDEDDRFTLFSIPLNDDLTFRLLGMGLTNGIAPLHNITAKSLLRSLGPKSLADLLQVLELAGKRRRMTAPETPEAQLQQRLDHMPDGILSYWCAYLKARHPVSFMTAMLSHSITSRGRMNPRQRPRFEIILREARKMAIRVLGPHINFSLFEFSQEQDKIRTGLMVIQGMGKRTYEEIDTVRRGQPFSSLADFCQRTDPRGVPHPVVVNLIKAGAFDFYEINRRKLLVELERALKNLRCQHIEYGESRVAGSSVAQLQLFDSSAFQTPESDKAHPSQDSEEENEFTPQDLMRYEREAVGYSISYDLLDYYEDLIRFMGAKSPFDLAHCDDGQLVYVAGFIDHTEREGALMDDDTEIAFDLEGYVVKMPHSVAKTSARLTANRGPILIEGRVEKYGKSEQYLLAQKLYRLEDIVRQAGEVGEVRINLSGQHKRKIQAVRQILKMYKGETPVRLVGSDSLSWWYSRGIDGSQIYVCPPLHQGLWRILPETHLEILDRTGKRMQF